MSVNVSRRRGASLPAFFRNSFVYSASQFLAKLLGLVENVLLRVILVPATLGLWNLVTVVQDFVANADLGFIGAANVELPVLEGGGRHDEAARVRATMMKANVVQGFIVAIVIALWGLIDDPSGGRARALGVAAALVLLGSVSSALQTFHQTHQSYPALSKALFLSSALAFVLLPGGGWLGGINGLFLGGILAAAAQCVLLYREAKREGIATLKGFDRAAMRGLVRFGLPLEVVEYPGALFGSVDSLIVAARFGLADLALYSTAKLFFLQTANLPSLVGNVFIMRMFGRAGAQVPRSELADEARRFLLAEYLVVHPLLVPAVVHGFAFLAAVAIPKYLGASHVLAVMMLGVYFVPQTTIIRNFWMLDKKLAKLAVSNVIGVVATVAAIGVAVWIKGLELDAIAWGSVVGHGVYFVFILVTVGREVWGNRVALAVGAQAALGAAASGVAALAFGLPAAHPTTVHAVGQLGFRLGVSVVIVAPVVAFGLHTTRLVSALRGAAPARPDDPTVQPDPSSPS